MTALGSAKRVSHPSVLAGDIPQRVLRYALGTAVQSEVDMVSLDSWAK